MTPSCTSWRIDWLDRWHGKLASVCPLMHDPDTSFVPWYSATGAATIPDVLRSARGLGHEMLERVRAMLVFDSLVHNTDRHANNFGILRDCRTGDVTGFAPLFDHNLALFAGDMQVDFESWPARGSKDRPAGSRMTFDGVAKLVMNDEARRMLGRAGQITLANSGDYPIDRARVKALNSYLHQRVEQLLAYEPVSEESMFETLGTLERR